MPGEPANYARPGTVYIYRKGAALSDSWREVAAPDATVGDAFGSSLALGEGRLFVAAGPLAVHEFEKRDTAWTLAATVAAKSVPGDSVRRRRRAQNVERHVALDVFRPSFFMPDRP